MTSVSLISYVMCSLNFDELGSYVSLYSSNKQSTPSDFDKYFDKKYSTIGQMAAEEMEEPITLAELKLAVQSLKSGKCPRPDGFPSEFYKKFLHELAP